MMYEVYRNKDKVIMRDDDLGIDKEVILKEKELADKEGLTVQPYREGEREFFDRYRHLEKQPDGKIVDIQQLKQDKQEREQELEANERNKQKLLY